MVGVLGPGRLGETHVAALARLRDQGLHVEPALFGRNPERVRELAQRYAIERTSTQLNELIDDPRVAVIDNCLSNNLHFEPLMRAIERGKHVFAEKPLTIELGEARRLLEAAQRAGLQHGVIQNMRFGAARGRTP